MHIPGHDESLFSRSGFCGLRSLNRTFNWLFTAMLSHDVNEAYYIIYQVITDYH